MKFGGFVYSIVKFIGFFTLNLFDFFVSFSKNDKDIFDNKIFDFTDVLESSYLQILMEYEQVKENYDIKQVKDFYKVDTDIGQDNNWKGFPLIIYNYLFRENVDSCPQTNKIIKQVPGCSSAMFSVLGPGKHILPHTGIYKGVVRGLLTLKAPSSGQCWIKINNQKIPFENGKLILFDETALHEVFNDSEEERVVLYLDIYRELSFPLNFFNLVIFNLLKYSPFILNIIKSYNNLQKIEIIEHKPPLKAIRI